MSHIDVETRLVGQAGSMEPKRTMRTQTLFQVANGVLATQPRRVLVVGCGDGIEAGVLARSLGAQTVGIDIGHEFTFDHRAAAPAQLMEMDAQSLSFPDNSFDLIYSFHALEHIESPEVALREMARVLSPDGGFIIGTPNKARLVGYIGSAATLGEKIRWNCVDLGMRLRGRWSNAAGAHAGFTEAELSMLCSKAFGAAETISHRYYKTLYAHAPRALRMLEWTGAERFMFPAVYVVGRNKK
ncbi:MAG: class SAM-dependent methyltransferase [Frankiales bacterium]|nr:class SAM-dependent methyltransferase [Frankiales bacterium]